MHAPLELWALLSRETVSIETSFSVFIKTLFSYELALHPTTLFDESGEMRKTRKLALKTKLQVACRMRNR